MNVQNILNGMAVLGAFSVSTVEGMVGSGQGWSFELVSHLLPPYPRSLGATSLGAAYSLVLLSPNFFI